MATRKLYGYPKKYNGGFKARALTDGHGKIIGYGHIVECRRVRPGQRGGWISNERCTYRFKAGSTWYACRGWGDGMAASCREMKSTSVQRAGLQGRRR